MGLGRCVVTHIICTIMQKKFHALWSLREQRENMVYFCWYVDETFDIWDNE